MVYGVIFGIILPNVFALPNESSRATTLQRPTSKTRFMTLADSSVARH